MGATCQVFVLCLSRTADFKLVSLSFSAGIQWMDQWACKWALLVNQWESSSCYRLRVKCVSFIQSSLWQLPFLLALLNMRLWNKPCWFSLLVLMMCKRRICIKGVHQQKVFLRIIFKLLNVYHLFVLVCFSVLQNVGPKIKSYWSFTPAYDIIYSSLVPAFVAW